LAEQDIKFTDWDRKDGESNTVFLKVSKAKKMQEKVKPVPQDFFRRKG